MKASIILTVISALAAKVSAKCWSEDLGYKCCSAGNTDVYYTDSDGEWGVEDGDWCGMATEEPAPATPAVPTVPDTPAAPAGDIPAMGGMGGFDMGGFGGMGGFDMGNFGGMGGGFPGGMGGFDMGGMGGGSPGGLGVFDIGGMGGNFVCCGGSAATGG